MQRRGEGRETQWEKGTEPASVHVVAVIFYIQVCQLGVGDSGMVGGLSVTCHGVVLALVSSVWLKTEQKAAYSLYDHIHRQKKTPLAEQPDGLRSD